MNPSVNFQLFQRHRQAPLRVRVAHLGSWVLLATMLSCRTPSTPAVDAAVAQDSGANAARSDARLEFKIEGRTIRTLTLQELSEHIQSEEITNCDGYYHRIKRFRGFALDRILAQGFAGESLGILSEKPFVLRARDGYTVPISGQRLLEGGAYIAFEDADHPGSWDPIGPQRANPAPFYLVWKEANQCDLDTHPRPWQLAVLEIARYESVFPHSVPHGVSESSAEYQGFQRFSSLCIRCHAINREGGRVGPELNVPQNITEYRPILQIRAYIRNPLEFRYGNMPAHPNLDTTALDQLIAYLTHMRSEKHDPDAADSGYLRDQ